MSGHVTVQYSTHVRTKIMICYTYICTFLNPKILFLMVPIGCCPVARRFNPDLNAITPCRNGSTITRPVIPYSTGIRPRPNDPDGIKCREKIFVRWCTRQ